MNIGNPIPLVVQRLFFRFWRSAVAILGLGLVAYLLFFRHLGALLPGYAIPELQSYQHSADWHTIAADPINAPYTIPVWLLTAVFHHHLYMTRLVAACFGVLAVAAFYVIIKRWYSFRIAMLGTLLFASSGALLHFARLGTPQILQASILGLLVLAIWYKRSHHRAFAGYVVLAVCGLLLYVPGMVWFELAGLALVWRSLLGQMHRMSRVHVIGNWGLFLIMLTPLVVSSTNEPRLLLTAAGLPQSLDVLAQFPSNLWHSFLAIGIHGIGDPLTWLDRLPILNAAERVLLALGLYAYLYHQRTVRAFFLAGSAILAMLLLGLGVVGFAVLVPLLYFFIIHGLDHFLGRWFAVFPRNPIARATGVIVVCIMLFFSVLYQARSYFVAWPHSTQTRQTYNLPPS